MYLFKKTYIFTILSLILLFSGCIKKFDTDGLTLKIDESELNKTSEYFPIKQDFVFANIDIKQPNIFISNTNRLNANMNINLSTILLKDLLFVDLFEIDLAIIDKSEKFAYSIYFFSNS